MRVGQLVEALRVGAALVRGLVADAVVHEVCLLLVHRERPEVAAVGVHRRERLLRRRLVARVGLAAGPHQVHRHVPRRRIGDVRDLVLVGRHRLAVAGLARHRLHPVEAEEPPVGVGELRLGQVGQPLPGDVRPRPVLAGRRLENQVVALEGEEALVVRPRSGRVQAALQVMGDVAFGLVHAVAPEVRRVAAHLGQRLLGGRTALGVRLPVGAHQRHPHVAGGVVHDVAHAVLSRLADELALGVAALAAHQRPRARETVHRVGRGRLLDRLRRRPLAAAAGQGRQGHQAHDTYRRE